MSHHVELDINQVGRGIVKLDGHQVNCRAIRIGGQAGKLTKVTIQLLARVSGKVEVEDFQSVKKREPEHMEDVTTTSSAYGSVYGRFRDNSTAEEVVKLIGGGILTPNEARAELGGDAEATGVA